MGLKKRKRFNLKQLRLVALIAIIGFGAYFGFKSEPPKPVLNTTSLEKQTLVQHAIKIEVIPELHFANPDNTKPNSHIPSSILFDLDVESYRNADYVHENFQDMCLLTLGDISIEPTSWEPYLSSDYQAKGKLLFKIPAASRAVVSANVIELYIFDPEERIYEWPLF